MKIIFFLILISQIISAQSWVKIQPAFHPEGDLILYYSSFVDEHYGWFVDGKFACVYRTTDGGYNWDMQINGYTSIDMDPHDIFFLDVNNGWLLVSMLGKTMLLITTDSGEYWYTYTVPTISKIYFFDKDNGIGAGAGGFYYTTDSGLNWSKSEYDDFSPGIEIVSKIFFLDSLNGYIACLQGGWSEGAGYLFRTTDGGKSWKKLAEPPHNVSDVFFFDLSKGFCASGLISGFWKTEDGGNSWTRVAQIPTFEILFLNENEGWGTDIFSGIIHTTDGGKTWSTVESNTFNFGRFHYGKQSGRIFVTGLGKTIFFSDNIVSVKDRSDPMSIKSFYIFQNYPNPFNPNTKIKYQVPVTSYVILKVYDVLGRDLETLVNGKKDAGYYEVEFNGSNFVSGTYFYRIQAGNYSDTRKMTLLK